jgi:TldD protein
VAGMAGWEIAEECDFYDVAEKVATDAVEMCTAKPLGSSGRRDLILSPSHAMLTIHEIVAHATELDRILGYEANYACTSFVKLSDVGKLKYGSKLFNITADKTTRGRRPGYDDDYEGDEVADRWEASSSELDEPGDRTSREDSAAAARSAARGATTSCGCRTSRWSNGQCAEARRDHRGHEERRHDRRRGSCSIDHSATTASSA